MTTKFNIDDEVYIKYSVCEIEITGSKDGTKIRYSLFPVESKRLKPFNGLYIEADESAICEIKYADEEEKMHEKNN